VFSEELTRAAEDAGLADWLPEEITFLADTVERARPDFIAEWGTSTGQSARLFCECRRLLGLTTVIHSTDIVDDICLPSGITRGHFVRDQDVSLHVGDGVDMSLAEHAAIECTRPLFFVDGDHRVDAVMRELRLIASSAPQAVMLLHDTKTDAGVAARAFLAEGARYAMKESLVCSGMMELWPE
jgi:cephalosporin hydroxylase